MGVLLSDDTVFLTTLSPIHSFGFIVVSRQVLGYNHASHGCFFSSEASGADWCPRVVSGWLKGVQIRNRLAREIRG